MEPINNIQEEFVEQTEYVTLNYATTGQRFANWLVDLIIFYVLNFLVFFILGFISYQIMPSVYDLLIGTSIASIIVRLIISFTICLLYFTCIEGATKGFSIGKLITGTRAVHEDGSALTWRSAFRRSLIRLIPFEPLSAIQNPWHDQWSGTTVIKRRA